MSFHHVVFPEAISYGSSGGPSFPVRVLEKDSGQEERISARQNPRHTFDVSKGVQSHEELFLVRQFYLARGGMANGFLYKDYSDFTSNPTNGGFPDDQGTEDQLIGTGNGSNTQFQLIKTYTSGPSSYVRKIQKPIASSVRVWVNGVEVFGFTVNETTGGVTLAAAPANGHLVKASFKFYVPVRFADETLNQSIDSFGDGSMQIPLIELLDEEGFPTEYMHGGSVERTISANLSLSMAQGRLWVVSATTTGLSLLLPDKATVPTGIDIFAVYNAGSNSFTIKDGATTVATVAAGKMVELSMSVDASSQKVWYAA
jgi:uncharacterized protein (TIGR02217 family)